MNKWNNNQINAIEARGGSILVSAAAGSGKTTVLVERIIRRIIDEGIDVDRFLVVTFTKAAAGELKNKILNALDSKLNESVSESQVIRLQKQKNLLPLASISTIDSFCYSLVKDNYQLLDISPKFEILSEADNDLYSKEVLEKTLDEIYETAQTEESKSVFDLIELLSDSKDDSKFSETVLLLHNEADAFPFFDQWIDSLPESFSGSDDFSDSIYGKIGISLMKGALNQCIEKSFYAKTIADGYEELNRVSNLIGSEHSFFKRLLSYIDNNDIEKADEEIRNFKYITFPTPKKISDTVKEAKDEILKFRDYYKKISDSVFDFFPLTEEKYNDENGCLLSFTKTIVSITKLFHNNLLSFKKEHNCYGFNDILHFAVELLAVPSNDPNVYYPTELAQQLRSSYCEILIDEFQDTNKAQNIVFEMISNDNLFCVGDVKQSIYRFRKAQPEIFISKYNSYSDYSSDCPSFPARIILGNNYRSRESVTTSVNYIFSQLMSRKSGEVDYGDKESLIQSYQYTETDEEVELHLVDSLSESEDSGIRNEASYISQLIKEKIDSGFLVQDKGSGGLRKCVFSDFVILSREVKVFGPIMTEELRKISIPSYVEADKEFFTSYEISLILNLLRIINNPMQDIPLMSVMTSVFFGFSMDELAELKIKVPSSDISLYSRIIALEKENGKIHDFLEKIRYWRNLSLTMSSSEFIRLIYDETDIENFVLIMKDPKEKRLNLSLLLYYASLYEKLGYIGLTGFLRFVERLENREIDFHGSLEKNSDQDSVKIMTIHKSKGLQSPIIICARLSKHFNLKDIYKPLIVSPKIGLGMKIKHTAENGIEYINESFAYKVLKRYEKNAVISEEMRLLYVALTRAEERLILVSSVKGLSEESKLPFKKLAYDLPVGNDIIDPFVVNSKNCFIEWIILALLRHPDCTKLRELAGLKTFDSFDKYSDFNIKIYTSVSAAAESHVIETAEQVVVKPNQSYIRLIKDAVEYKYKYLPLTKQVSKQAASKVAELSVDNPYFASKVPSFMYTDGFSASQIGTITHSFMQYVDFSKIEFDGRTVIGVEDEISRLVGKMLLSEAEAKAINIRAVKRFFSSSLARRMKNSPCIMREKKFTVHLPIDFYNKELSDFKGEEFTVQGIADAVFEEDGKLVIVDYKTDRLETEDEFTDRYWSQLKTYKEAMLQCTDYNEVKSLVIYSFYLNKSIELND